MAAWTTPHTYIVGEVLTAATMNTFVRDNETYLFDRLSVLGGTPSVPVTMTTINTYYTGASLSVPAGTWQLIAAVAVQTSLAGDRVDFSVFNSTDSTEIAVRRQANSGVFVAATLAVGVVFAGTKTVIGRARNPDTAGGTVTVANLVAIRTVP